MSEGKGHDITELPPFLHPLYYITLKFRRTKDQVRSFHWYGSIRFSQKTKKEHPQILYPYEVLRFFPMSVDSCILRFLVSDPAIITFSGTYVIPYDTVLSMVW